MGIPSVANNYTVTVHPHDNFQGICTLFVESKSKRILQIAS